MLRAMQWPPSSQKAPSRHALWAAAWLLVVSAVQAAPAASDDPVSRFLVEKGLVGSPVASASPNESDFVRQVRDKASEMVLTAMNFLGVPYRRGGTTGGEDGFDCSGFTRHVFEMSLGLVLPRRADEQARAPGMFQVKRDELKPGDLVFFNTLKRTFSHVGIYVGDGKFIHSPRTGGEVRVEDMRLAYWSKRYNGARRAEPMADTAAAEAAPASAQGAASAKATAPSARPR
jgi:cell wall-associated NlpC family hydrolase